MTMKIADIAPDEAEVIDVSECLSELLSTSTTVRRAVPDLNLDPAYLDAARTILTTLSEQVATPTVSEVSLTRQQIETYLDFDPEFLEVAKVMLRDFIDRSTKLSLPVSQYSNQNRSQT